MVKIRYEVSLPSIKVEKDVHLIKGGNWDWGGRDDPARVCGRSFPWDNNHQVQESLWNWVSLYPIDTDFNLLTAQIPRGEIEGWCD